MDKTRYTAEDDRTRLIGELVTLLKCTAMPDDARAAGLVLIGWLARRMPGEGPHSSCCTEMIERARASGVFARTTTRVKRSGSGR